MKIAMDTITGEIAEPDDLVKFRHRAGRDYLCPECREPVIPAVGPRKTPYFRHYSGKSDCILKSEYRPGVLSPPRGHAATRLPATLNAWLTKLSRVFRLTGADLPSLIKALPPPDYLAALEWNKEVLDALRALLSPLGDSCANDEILTCLGEERTKDLEANEKCGEALVFLRFGDEGQAVDFFEYPGNRSGQLMRLPFIAFTLLRHATTRWYRRLQQEQYLVARFDEASLHYEVCTHIYPGEELLWLGSGNALAKQEAVLLAHCRCVDDTSIAHRSPEGVDRFKRPVRGLPAGWHLLIMEAGDGTAPGTVPDWMLTSPFVLRGGLRIAPAVYMAGATPRVCCQALGSIKWSVFRNGDHYTNIVLEHNEVMPDTFIEPGHYSLTIDGREDLGCVSFSAIPGGDIFAGQSWHVPQAGGFVLRGGWPELYDGGTAIGRVFGAECIDNSPTMPHNGNARNLEAMAVGHLPSIAQRQAVPKPSAIQGASGVTRLIMLDFLEEI